MFSVANMCSAMDRTLSLSELREKIILFLPARKILTLQIVCKLWRDNIVGSMVIQQRLFLKPLVIPVDPDRFTTLPNDPYPVFVDRTPAEYDQELAINQFLPLSVPLCCDFKETGSSLLSYMVMMRRVNPVDIASGQRPSWREMFVTQPPCTIAHLNICYMIEGTACSTSHGCSVKDTDGLKLGMIFGLADKMATAIDPAHQKQIESCGVAVTLKIAVCKETNDGFDAAWAEMRKLAAEVDIAEETSASECGAVNAVARES